MANPSSISISIMPPFRLKLLYTLLCLGLVSFYSILHITASSSDSAAAPLPSTGRPTSPPASSPLGHVRINQVGFEPHAKKVGVLLFTSNSQILPPTSFHVLDVPTQRIVFTGVVGPKKGIFNRQYHTHLLDFTAYSTPSSIRLVVPVNDQTNVTSPITSISPATTLIGPLIRDSLFYFASNRDGDSFLPSPHRSLPRKPSHLQDRTATVYYSPPFHGKSLSTNVGKLTPVQGVGQRDVSGGWYDAGDYLKFTHTASFATVILLSAVRDLGPQDTVTAAQILEEANVGLSWLLKMWDGAKSTLYLQVGLGDGNGRTIFGDHDKWRLPESDEDVSDTFPGDGYYHIKYRPVFRAHNPPEGISPNLAGAVAAAFALGSQVYRSSNVTYANLLLLAADSVYSMARTQPPPQTLTTTEPEVYYSTTSWQDDMEYAATQLYLALHQARVAGTAPANTSLSITDELTYLQQAASYFNTLSADVDHASAVFGLDEIGMLAHRDLHRALKDHPKDTVIRPAAIENLLKNTVELYAAHSVNEPFGSSFRGGIDVVPKTLGTAVAYLVYQHVTGDDSHAYQLQALKDYVYGSNAWGSSFVVGAGKVYPRCLHHQLANLLSVTLRGAVVGGAYNVTILSELASRTDPAVKPCAHLAPFLDFVSADGLSYVDHVASYPSSEPSLDYVSNHLLVNVLSLTMPAPKAASHSSSTGVTESAGSFVSTTEQTRRRRKEKKEENIYHSRQTLQPRLPFE